MVTAKLDDIDAQISYAGAQDEAGDRPIERRDGE
jgi:hypothetical protein